MFMATRIDHEETRELAAYSTIVLQLASKHIGGGWRSYDWQFRLQKKQPVRASRGLTLILH